MSFGSLAGLVVRSKYESTIEDFSDNKSISPALEYFVSKMAEEEEDSTKLYEIRRRETTIFHSDRSGSSSLFTQKVQNLFGSNVAMGGVAADNLGSAGLSNQQPADGGGRPNAGTSSPKKLHLARRDRNNTKRSPVKRASTGSVPENLTPRSGKLSGVEELNSRSGNLHRKVVDATDPSQPLDPQHQVSNERRRGKEEEEKKHFKGFDSLKDSEWVRMFLSPEEELGAGSACEPATGEPLVSQIRASPKKGSGNNTNEATSPYNSNDRGHHVSFVSPPTAPIIPLFDCDVGQSETHATRVSGDPTELNDQGLDRSQPSKRALFLSSTSCSQFRNDNETAEEALVVNSLLASKEGEVADSGGVISAGKSRDMSGDKENSGNEKVEKQATVGAGSGGASGENSIGTTTTTGYQSSFSNSPTPNTTSSTGTITQLDTPNTVTLSLEASEYASLQGGGGGGGGGGGDYGSAKIDQPMESHNISLLKQLLLNTIPTAATAANVSASTRKKHKQQQDAKLRSSNNNSSTSPSRDPLNNKFESQMPTMYTASCPTHLGVTQLNLAQLHFNTSESADDFGVDYGVMKSVRSRSRSRSASRNSLSHSLSHEASPSLGGNSSGASGKRYSSGNTSTSPAKLSASTNFVSLPDNDDKSDGEIEVQQHGDGLSLSERTKRLIESAAIQAREEGADPTMGIRASTDFNVVDPTEAQPSGERRNLAIPSHSPTPSDFIAREHATTSPAANSPPLAPEAIELTLLSSSGFFNESLLVPQPSGTTTQQTAMLNGPLISGIQLTTGLSLESTTTAISTQFSPPSLFSNPNDPSSAFTPMSIPLISLSRQVVDTDFLAPNFSMTVPHTPTGNAPMTPISMNGLNYSTSTTTPSSTTTVMPSLSPPYALPSRIKPNINANVHSISGFNSNNNSSISASPSPTITISSSPSPRSLHHSPVRSKFGHSLLRRAEGGKTKPNNSVVNAYGGGDRAEDGERFDNEVINTSSNLPAQFKYAWNDIITTWNIAPKMSRDVVTHIFFFFFFFSEADWFRFWMWFLDLIMFPLVMRYTPPYTVDPKIRWQFPMRCRI
jgi:hypothetical protein